MTLIQNGARDTGRYNQGSLEVIYFFNCHKYIISVVAFSILLFFLIDRTTHV